MKDEMFIINILGISLNHISKVQTKIELKELIEDLEKNRELLSFDSSQYHRRNYLHSLFSLFEASLSNLREDVATKLNYKMFSKEQFK